MSKTETERRIYKRHDIGCPVGVVTGGAGGQVRGKTINISDGGMLVTVPADFTLDLGRQVHTCVAVPRTTPNTHMFEDFEFDATVVRCDPVQEAGMTAVALQFRSAADINIEV